MFININIQKLNIDTDIHTHVHNDTGIHTYIYRYSQNTTIK